MVLMEATGESNSSSAAAVAVADVAERPRLLVPST
jgi:hypothetical protein